MAAVLPLTSLTSSGLRGAPEGGKAHHSAGHRPGTLFSRWSPQLMNRSDALHVAPSCYMDLQSICMPCRDTRRRSWCFCLNVYIYVYIYVMSCPWCWECRKRTRIGYFAAFACRALTEAFSGLRLHGHMAGTVHISRTFEELGAQGEHERERECC